MNNATLVALRDMATNNTMLRIIRTKDGFEVQRGSKVLGVTKTMSGAEELCSLHARL